MHRNAAKDRERRILDSIYDAERLVEIVASERPDFLLETPSGHRFGVEVTELFETESHARLRRIPSYFSELLDGGDVRHGDDREVLQVCRVNISKETGELRASDVPMIITPMPPLNEYRSSLVKRIKTKAIQRRDYPKGLAFSTLIIADNTRRFSGKKREQLVGALLTERIKRSVEKSGYREVYLLTSAEGSIYYFPLVMATLLSELCMFNHTLVNLATEDLDPPQHMRLFRQFMLQRGFRIGTPEGDPDAMILGGVAVTLDADFHVSVLDHYDCVAPPQSSPATGELSGKLPEGFMAQYDRLSAANEFVSPLGFDARLNGW